MKRPVSLIAMLALLSTLSSCQNSTEVDQPRSPDPSIIAAVQRPVFRVSDLSTPQLGPIDESRAFHYKYESVNPDSILTELWLAGIPVTRGLLPVDNLCSGPIGPRFTVELAKEVDTIRKFDFVPGSGRLMCATKVREYLVVPR
jgi:hypothetical protein